MNLLQKIKNFDPNKPAHAKELEAHTKRVQESLVALSQYAEYGYYLDHLRILNSELVEIMKSAKSWDQYLEVRAQIRLIEDIIDNSTFYPEDEEDEEDDNKEGSTTK
jgi:hypothetical protein